MSKSIKLPENNTDIINKLHATKFEVDILDVGIIEVTSSKGDIYDTVDYLFIILDNKEGLITSEIEDILILTSRCNELITKAGD